MARGDVQITNPSTRWFKWLGSTGTLAYYDKVLKEDIEVPTPFTFLLLDTFTTIKGYDKTAEEGIYANEVKDLSKQIITVKAGKEVIASGLYSEIKEKAIARGGKYTQSCYIAFKDESGKLVIGNISMSGSAFGGGTHLPADKKMKDIEIGAWMDFSKANSAELLKKAVVLEGRDERICTNGSTQFYAPKFKLVDVTKETDDAAIALTQTLKAYMAEYFKKDATAAHESEHIEEQVAAAHESVFGKNAASELTEAEKLFMVKHEAEKEQAVNMGGPLPGEEDSFVDFDPNLDLPF